MLSKGIPIPNDSTLKTLGPIIDKRGILRIGRRLNQLQLSKYEKKPSFNSWITPTCSNICTSSS